MAEQGGNVQTPKAPPKPDGNPAFRMMGLPRLSRLKLPSRNWLIFLSLSGSWIATLSYDRYHKKRAQRKWCNFVSHLSKESMPGNMLPRKITILLEAPPGDGIRPAREYFHEYVKPILVAGAIDWEVIEGRREGEIRYGLAEKIRKLREKRGERSRNADDEVVQEGEEGQEEDLVSTLRQRAGIKEWEGVQGDLVIGRHTWKEYIRGLHEGWLGPLKAPEEPRSHNFPVPDEAQAPSESTASEPDAPKEEKSTSESENPKPPEKSSASSLAPPYISTDSYATSPIATTIPSTLSPSTPLPLPHLLGLKHTPTRIHRFLTRRHLADSTGAQVAALVLAAHSRPYGHSTSYASSADPDEASPSLPSPNADVVATGASWEQTKVLEEEESGWHKSAKAPLKEGEEDRERTWTESIVIDDRIGQRMRLFDLEEGAEARAASMVEEARKKDPSLTDKVKKWAGWKKEERRGWNMGEEGDEYS